MERTETERDEATRRLTSLENAEALTAEKCDDQVTNSFFYYFAYDISQEISLKRAVLEAENAVREREDLERRVKVLEAELEQAEDRADTFCQQFKNAESENTQLTSCKFQVLLIMIDCRFQL